MARAVTVDVDRANRGGGVTEHSPDKSGSMVSLMAGVNNRRVEGCWVSHPIGDWGVIRPKTGVSVTKG